MKERNKLLGRLRLAALYAFVIGLVISSRPTLLTVAVGTACVLLGEGVRFWAAGHLEKSVRLVTSGPYAHTQSPLYLGRLLILTGLGLAARYPAYLNLLALVAGYAIFFLYYMPRKVRVEGDRLARLHGDAYEEYRRRVPILFPSFKAYPGDRLSWSLRQMVKNQEPLVILGLATIIGYLWYLSLHT